MVLKVFGLPIAGCCNPNILRAKTRKAITSKTIALYQ